MKTENFIEIIGEGEYKEEVEQFIMDINIEVRSTTEEKALSEMKELKEKCIHKLLESSISKEDLFDGGFELGNPWYRSKKRVIMQKVK